jgi:predicted dehydrogenase
MLGLDEARLYPTFTEMMAAEGKREDKIDFVVIATPNDSHYPIAKAALEQGIHVVCDKPLAPSSREAEVLDRLARDRGLLFCVTYAYTAYPMVKHMRAMVANGDLGEIRFVHGEYPQEWLATPLERTGQKQSLWRTDPARAGISNCVGDIGSHIEHMVAYVTGLEIERLCARLDRIGEGRVLDDNASILIDYKGGARGIYWSSQIAIGHDNGFRIRVYGTKGGFEWVQESPNYLTPLLSRRWLKRSSGRSRLRTSWISPEPQTGSGACATSRNAWKARKKAPFGWILHEAHFLGLNE